MNIFKYWGLFVCLFIAVVGIAQTNTGSGSFLTISPDVRSVAMGETGVASRAGAFSAYRNPAQAVFAESAGEIAYVFSPWMREGEETDLHGAAGYYRFGKNAILADFRLFKYSSLPLFDEQGNHKGDFTPGENLFVVGYARRLCKGLGVGVNVKYITSDFKMGGIGKVANTMACDLGIYYRRQQMTGIFSFWSVGLKMSDLGGKLDYGYGKYGLPGRATLGGAMGMNWKGKHDFEGVVDMGYLFMPENSNVFTGALGIEYRYDKWVALRAGYHYEEKEKGRGDYASVGIGLSWKHMNLDGSYLLSGQESMLRNTWMIAVGVDFGIFAKWK